MDPPFNAEQQLLRRLRDSPKEHAYRYTPEAHVSLLKDLFASLSGYRPEYLSLLFPDGVPTETTPAAWTLSAAQGAVEGAEYGPAARGKPCGHIFKHGEATYRCKTCSLDDTCVLCSKCFDASDHEGHMVFVNISLGNSGCCDCGDAEAWRIPVKCAIHTSAPDSSGPMETDTESSELPPDLVRSIRGTIAVAIDYLCDVLSCSPEQLRQSKGEEEIRRDEEQSRLTARYHGGDLDTENIEFALVLWNDEKHTVNEVQEQVARACRKSRAWGQHQAQETDSMGRSILAYNQDVRELLRISKIVEQIKITVTIRSARDTFREQMCGSIVEWLSDIAGCSVAMDNDILRTTICQELLGVWRVGSEATNTEVGKDGIDDHALDEDIRQRLLTRRIFEPVELATETDEDMDMDDGPPDDEDPGPPEGEDVDMVGGVTINVERLLAANIDDMDVGMGPLLGGLDMTTDTPPEPVAIAGDEGQQPAVADDMFLTHIPKTPKQLFRRGPPAPLHWVEKPVGYSSRHPLAPFEDPRQRVRLDRLIMFDLRMWKKARIDLRDLYISTVVAIPEFKRILGLRFAGLYTTLSQLYLIADREPDHSIINLSLQMLTTPSITGEVVLRRNFLTTLMAILYTFLTTRQVGFAYDVNPNAVLAFETNSLANPLTNRRMYHFFNDLRYLLGSDYVQERIRKEPRYTLQFLDLARLHQGICPNVRAVAEHVEYEVDAWISASLITREINKLAKLFPDSFKGIEDAADLSLQRTITTTTRYTAISSMGWDRHRYRQAELKGPTEFKKVSGYTFDTDEWDNSKAYTVVDYDVSHKPISFHHALHYTLSWLVQAGNNMPAEQMRDLLLLDLDEVKLAAQQCNRNTVDYIPEDIALAIFDFPLRVCVWVAQMKTNMWVRNGFSLKHQMQTYRSVSQRDLTHNRDIFLLQTSLVTVDPSRMLVNMIDRFSLHDWVQGKFTPPTNFDEGQLLDITEDFLHLLIVILSDRLALIPLQEEPNLQALKLRRELVHILCFKSMLYSELTSRLPERVQEHDLFHKVLQELTNYRAPDGLSDSGTFSLKAEYLDEVDPYNYQFSKNQREETESNYRARQAKATGKPETDVVFEPRLRPIKSGIFAGISSFTRTPVFAQIIYSTLAYALSFETDAPSIQASRVEVFLQLCLHLCQLAVLEDQSLEGQEAGQSFIMHALEKKMSKEPGYETIELEDDNGARTIATALHKLSGIETFKACWSKINYILHTMMQRKPTAFAQVGPWASEMGEEIETEEDDKKETEAERKKQMAKERQARIMAQMKQQQQSFMANNDFDFGEDSDEEIDDAMAAEQKKSWQYPTGNCIICQETLNDSKLYGTLALVTESSIVRQTDVSSCDYLYEVAKTPSSLDRDASSIRPFGVAHMNRQAVKKLTSDGSEFLAERQGLGQGFPSKKVERGPVAVGCSHLMHFKCFEEYHDATRRRHPLQIARNHPERIEKKEFVCPLCKALGNTFFPIVWKSKEETPNGVLTPAKTFETWLSEVGPSINRMDKAQEGAQNSSEETREMFRQYCLTNVIPVISEKIQSSSTTSAAEIVANTTSPSVTGFILPDVIARQARLPPVHELEELQKIYRRIRDSYRENGISTVFSIEPDPFKPDPPDLIRLDGLALSVGFSITSLEIGQRGIEAESGCTLLDRIPEQNLTNLRILSETVSTYIAVGTLQTKEATASKTFDQFRLLQKQQLETLFLKTHGFVEDKPKMKVLRAKPLLARDPFVFLVDCTFFSIPAFGWDVMNVLQLCYMAEFVRAVIAIGRELDIINILREWERAERLGELEGHIGYTEAQLDVFSRFIKHIGVALEEPDKFTGITSFSLAVFRHMAGKYLTPFLRKSVILLNTKYGITFPPAGFADIAESEAYRLSQALRLPDIDTLLETALASPEFRDLITSWCRELIRRKLKPSLSHPAIFELVGLPLNFDVLVEESMRRRCPSTGKHLQDPSVCLFCGEIFCSQALCCLEDDGEAKIGGCNKHLKRCGKDIGLFINIRKCGLLYLHARNGSWAATPYLDAHGETDLGLRRNRQLFLSQKRYDAIRNTWLQHGVPSVISRKLEADMNTGGWESI